MAAESANLAAPLWAYREPPAGLSAEWDRVYRALVDPITRTATLRGKADCARRGTRELFAAWLGTLRDSTAGARVVLQFLHGQSSRTWRVGHAILTAITPIEVALCSAVRFLTHPHPTRNGPAATADSVRSGVADKLVEFDPFPLLDALSSAVVADCAAQRGSPAKQAKHRKRSTKMPTIPDTYKRPMELLPEFQALLQQAGRRWTVEEFCSWLWTEHGLKVRENEFSRWRESYMRAMRRTTCRS